ncbi:MULTISPECIES: COQ9 family protein [unclassified Paracoccus (in: a-proteobacteria)]|uniref:COQ9 family protein n=1 Tax=unclassified Paracoccus (in: a-proteobacteria) TaxID=2688777 RepID=UPI0012B26815|nr:MULTISPECIES: COQ9 family protein [unclassified Paracoccus (in: a-proteobacteria)]UXU75446.1 COQ9 family protein [Paracoccus sp. SMMA_5]UXU81351.1 COQ9 family protein [Paracoccus sp. SMMA_5_TC]
MTEERERLIQAALAHVVFEGMGDRAIVEGARDIGISPDLARVYLPRGGADLAAAYHRQGDAALRQWLASDPPQGRMRERVAQAVMHRLGLSDRELARAGASVLALPQHAGLGARLVWETADAIWEGLGDISQDVNWYSKRATLSAVYGATALYWLGDESPDLADTRAFLDRRLDGVMRFESLKARLRAIPGVGTLSDLATGWIRRPEPRNLPGGLRADASARHNGGQG